MDEEKIDQLAKILSKQIDKEIFERKYAPAKAVLLLGRDLISLILREHCKGWKERSWWKLVRKLEYK